MYWEDDTKPDTVGKVRISGNYTLAKITGLNANMVYYLTVAACNTAGPGLQSAPINITTRKSREFIPKGGIPNNYSKVYYSWLTSSCSEDGLSRSQHDGCNISSGLLVVSLTITLWTQEEMSYRGNEWYKGSSVEARFSLIRDFWLHSF